MARLRLIDSHEVYKSKLVDVVRDGRWKKSGRSIITSDAYRTTPILLDIAASLFFTLTVTGLIQADLPWQWLSINISTLTVALTGCIVPINVTFFSRAEDVDSIIYPLKCPHGDHAYLPNCCVHYRLQEQCQIRSNSPDSHKLYPPPSNCTDLCVPNLLFSLSFLLLILSGDVELNPGPQGVTFTIENLVQKLRDIKQDVETLKKLGTWLNVPPSERASLQQLVSYFIEVHPFGSWRTVIWALDAIEKHSIADTIRDHAEINEDSSLTVENVTIVVLETTKDWYGAFGDSMAIPWTIQEQIKDKFMEMSDQKRALMEYWVKTLHDASWVTLAGVLYQMEEKKALQMCTRFLITRREPTLNLQNLLRLLQDVKDWEKLAYYLDIPWTTRAKLKEEHKEHEPLLWGTAMLTEWLTNHPAPTWKLVANALSWMGRRNTKLHEALKSIYHSERYLPDPESKRLCTVLNRAVREGGTLEQTIVQLHLSGTARSGKTSLIRRLMGKKAQQSEPSTGIANKAVRMDITKSSVVVDETVWREISDINEESSVILNGMRDNMSRLDSMVTEYVVISSDSEQLSDVELTASAVNGTPEVPQQPIPECSLDASVNPVKVFESAILKAKQEIRRTKDPLSIYITDIGGQHEFQELIPALVSGPSVFLLVIPAHWGLNNTFPVEYLNEDGSLRSSYKASVTLKEYVLQTLATIMYIGNSGAVFPKVLFVLTFKDQVTTSELQAVDEELQAAIMATEAFKLNMIEFATQYKLCHSINNLSEDDTDVLAIRQTIERIGKHNEDYHVYTPYTWQFFGITLRSLGAPIIKYSTCIEVAKRCGISSRDDVNAALSHFHEQTGVIRYYQNIDELQDIVFLNPQVLFDQVSQLVTNSFTFQQVRKFESEEFSKKGMFSVNTLEKIMSKSAQNLFTVSRFVAFLKHHHIIAPVRGNNPKFFLPCILARVDPSKNPSTSSIIQPLLVAFKSGYLPRGLFGFMIAHFLDDDSSNEFVMELASDLGQIYRNQITFCIEPYLDTVRFTSCASCIRIDVIPSSVQHTLPIGSICFHLRERVQSILNQIAEQLNYNSHAKYQLAFLCPHSPEEHPAIITFSNNQPAALKCTLRKEASELPTGYNVWFDKSENTVLSRQSSTKGEMGPRLAQLKLLKTSDGEKIEIIKTVAPTWKSFGVHMDFDSTGSHLNLIEAKYGHRDPEGCCTALFEHWLLRNGKLPVTWGTVTELLEDAGHGRLAEKVKLTLRL